MLRSNLRCGLRADNLQTTGGVIANGALVDNSVIPETTGQYSYDGDTITCRVDSLPIQGQTMWVTLTR